MALKALVIALGVTATTSPAAIHDPASPAPAGTAETKYCMYIEAITGSRLEQIKCWTREEWTENGVDVDKDWAREGVRTIG